MAVARAGVARSISGSGTVRHFGSYSSSSPGPKLKPIQAMQADIIAIAGGLYSVSVKSVLNEMPMSSANASDAGGVGLRGFTLHTTEIPDQDSYSDSRNGLILFAINFNSQRRSRKD